MAAKEYCIGGKLSYIKFTPGNQIHVSLKGTNEEWYTSEQSFHQPLVYALSSGADVRLLNCDDAGGKFEAFLVFEKNP